MIVRILTVSNFCPSTPAGGSFNTFLNALDASYCTYEGGDDPTVDPVYPDSLGGYQGEYSDTNFIHDIADMHVIEAEECGQVSATYVISTSYAVDEASLTPAYMQRQCNEYAKVHIVPSMPRSTRSNKRDSSDLWVSPYYIHLAITG